MISRAAMISSAAMLSIAVLSLQLNHTCMCFISFGKSTLGVLFVGVLTFAIYEPAETQSDNKKARHARHCRGLMVLLCQLLVNVIMLLQLGNTHQMTSSFILYILIMSCRSVVHCTSVHCIHVPTLNTILLT